MSHLLNTIDGLRTRLKTAWEVLRLDERRARVVELEGMMNEGDFWQDQARARGLSQEAAEAKKEIEEWDELRREIDDVAALVSLSEGEGDQGMIKEAEASVLSLDSRLSSLEFSMLLSGEYDQKNAIISLHAGAGGTDATDWVGMLVRMFTRFAEAKGWQVDVLDESRGEEAGYKSITIAVRGRYAYGFFVSEAGVHRLVRISPFDAEQMRHTTFALVEVLPEFDEVDASHLEIDPDDLRIDTFMSSGKGGQSVNTTYSAVRITHLPTGISVSCQNERSQSQNKATAMSILRAKLVRLMEEARATKLSDIKGAHKTAAWGNQIRSYVLHPYKMVKDHRTDVETSDAEGVIEGDLLPFMEAYLRNRTAQARVASQGEKR